MKVKIGKFKTKGTQKIEVRIDKQDTWNMDTTLAYIIHPMLIQLKDTTHGYPSDSTSEDWSDTLDKMIWSFGELTRNTDLHNFYKDGVYDTAAHAAYMDRIKEGLNLFGLYYLDLWD